jgi:hypothetical protein
MSTLALVAALAAQATEPSGTRTPPADAATNGVSNQQGTINFVEFEAGAGYSSNPQQDIAGSTGAGFGRFSIHGVHSRVSSRTATSISALAQESIYTRNGSNFSAHVQANHSAQVSERFSIYGSVEGSIDKGGQLDSQIVGNPLVPGVPGTQQPPILLPGQNALFVRGRTYSLRADAGGSLALSTLDSLHFNSGVQYLDSKSGVFTTHYTTIPLSLGYDRRLSSRTSVGGAVQYQHTAYDGPRSFWDVSPRLTIHQALSEQMTLSASFGPSFATNKNGLTTDHSTGLAGDLSLCSLGKHSDFCGTVSLSQQVATAFGTSKSISANINYSRRLDANQTLRFSVDGSWYSSPNSLVTVTSLSNATYVHGAADYSRRFGSRWFGGAAIGARKLTQPGPDPKMEFSGSLFIRYRLGDLG